MSFRTRDFMRHGPNAYLTVWDWYSKAENPIAGDDCLTYIFSYSEEKIEELFEHLYFPVKEMVYDETEQTYSEETNYYDCGLDFDTILRDFLEIYGERKLYQPYFFEDETGNRRNLVKMANVIQSVIDLNYYKYKKLAATLGFVYDPISNYDMTEEGKDTATPSGTETMSHTVDATKLNYIEATGPLSEVSASEDSLDISFSMETKVATTQKGVTDLRSGRQVKLDGGGAISDTIGTDIGTNSEVDHFVTTMDDASRTRLQGYDETKGDTAQASNISTEVDYPVTGTKRAGSPNAVSYTDTKSFTNKKEVKDHELTRKGNIGVTTSQQMIESERQIVRISLIKEFFDDLTEKILLSVW